VKRGHKYGAVRTEVDGVKFASKAEARRYSELKLLERAGQIFGLQLQPPFRLEVGRECIGIYKADFSYRDKRDGRTVVEDVKGFKTELYRWKKKHVEAQYGITITEITK